MLHLGISFLPSTDNALQQRGVSAAENDGFMPSGPLRPCSPWQVAAFGFPPRTGLPILEFRLRFFIFLLLLQ